jgi:hypothetical protein
MELITGLEPVTSYLPSKCSTAELYEPVLQHPKLRWHIISLKIDKLNLFYGKYFMNGGGGWIRTNVLVENRFTVCRL